MSDNMAMRKWDARREQSSEGVTLPEEYANLPTKAKIAVSVFRNMDMFPTIVRPSNDTDKEIAVAATKAWWLLDRQAYVAERAAELAVERAAEAEEEDLSNDDSSEEGYHSSPCMGGPAVPSTAETLAQRKHFFIEALPACEAMTAGFGMDTNKKWCYCPMSSNMKYWRNIFQYDMEPCTETNISFNPEPLRDHITSKGDDWHRIAAHYLQCLYPKPAPPRSSHKRKAR
jgi:hypothetical protein